MNWRRILLTNLLLVCLIEHQSDRLCGQEVHAKRYQVEPSIKWTSPISEQVISLQCKNCSLLNFGKALNDARDTQGFPLLFDDYDKHLKTNSLALSKDTRRISLNLHEMDFWNAAGKISSKTNLGLLVDFDGYPYLTDGLDTPSKYWTVVGPMLLRAHFKKKDKSRKTEQKQSGNTTRIKLNFLYGDGEADCFDMQFDEITVRTKSNKQHCIKLKRYTDGTRFGDIPVSKDEVATIHGSVIANVAKKLLWLKIHPNSVCKDKMFGLRAKCSEVKSTKRLIVKQAYLQNIKKNNSQRKSLLDYKPGKGFNKVYYTTIELEWDTDISEAQKLRCDKQLPLDRLDVGGINFVKKIMDNNLILNFVRNRACDIAALNGETTSRLALFSAAPNFIVEHSNNRINVTLFSVHRQKVDICHELLFARKVILKKKFIIAVNPVITGRKK